MSLIGGKCVTIIKNIHPIGRRIRPLSTSPEKKDISILTISKTTGVATLIMRRKPINALDTELLGSLRSNLEKVEKSKCRGLILTSSLRRVFCAGLDINELYQPDRKRLIDFYKTFQDVALLLGTQTAPVAALISGHAPAGGCALSTCCEYRVMLPNFTIGLNETAVGLVPPKWVIDNFLETLPRRTAELALTQGRLFLSESALQVGLVDEVVNDKEEGKSRCLHFFDGFEGVNTAARAQTKKQFRVNDLLTNRDADLKSFVGHVLEPHVQENIGIYLEHLHNRDNKGK